MNSIYGKHIQLIILSIKLSWYLFSLSFQLYFYHTPTAHVRSSGWMKVDRKVVDDYNIYELPEVRSWHSFWWRIWTRMSMVIEPLVWHRFHNRKKISRYVYQWFVVVVKAQHTNQMDSSEEMSKKKDEVSIEKCWIERCKLLSYSLAFGVWLHLWKMEIVCGNQIDISHKRICSWESRKNEISYFI